MVPGPCRLNRKLTGGAGVTRVSYAEEAAATGWGSEGCSAVWGQHFPVDGDSSHVPLCLTKLEAAFSSRPWALDLPLVERVL